MSLMGKLVIVLVSVVSLLGVLVVVVSVVVMGDCAVKNYKTIIHASSC